MNNAYVASAWNFAKCTYVMQQGDTLAGIANAYGVTYQVLLDANPVIASAVLFGQQSFPGTALTMPAAACAEAKLLFTAFPTPSHANPGKYAPGQEGAGPTVYIPANWDLDKRTYRIQPGDTLAQLAFFAGVQCPPALGGGQCGPNNASYVHNLNVLNVGVYSDPSQIYAGLVINVPTQAAFNVFDLGCPSGFARAASGSLNCVQAFGPPSGGPKASPQCPPGQQFFAGKCQKIAPHTFGNGFQSTLGVGAAPGSFPRILRAPSPAGGTCQCYHECHSCGPDVCCGYRCYCGRGVPKEVALEAIRRQNGVTYPGPCTQVCDSGKPPVCSWFCSPTAESLRLHPLSSGGPHLVLRRSS